MKASILVDASLPIGLAANCAAVLGVSLGAAHKEIVGPTVTDASGASHPGITSIPLPILAASVETLHDIAAAAAGDPDLLVTGFNHTARSCVSYADYQAKMATVESPRLLGLLIAGPSKSVARLTGALPLLK